MSAEEQLPPAVGLTERCADTPDPAARNKPDMAGFDAAARAIAPAAPVHNLTAELTTAAVVKAGKTAASSEGAGPSKAKDAEQVEAAEQVQAGGLQQRDAASASQCPICYEPMAAKVPHIYPCGHVYCRECSEKVRFISSLRCL